MSKLLSIVSFVAVLALAVAGFLGWKQYTATTHQQQQAINHLLSSHEQDSQTWVLKEVSYLVHLARYRLELTDNVPVAIALLQQADHRLASLHSPQFVAKRKVLAEDIAALQAVPEVDFAGVVSRINALNQQVMHLPAIPEKLEQPAAVNDIFKSVKGEKPWRKELATTIKSLKGMLIVRHLNQPLEPLLPPKLHAYLVANIQVQLNLAEWAALHQRPKVYGQTLQQAMSWVNQYFPTGEHGVQTVLKGIAELLKIDVKPQLPNIETTL